MSEDNPLQRAHALSAQANLLLKSPPSVTTLQAALTAYRGAAELFSIAGEKATDEGAKKTLELLTSQQNKLAKDVERRLSQLSLSSEKGQEASASMSRRGSGVGIESFPGEGGGPVTEKASSQGRRGSADASATASPQPGAGRPTSIGGPTSPGVTTAGLAARLTPSFGIPPFALRPSSLIPSNPLSRPPPPATFPDTSTPTRSNAAFSQTLKSTSPSQHRLPSDSLSPLVSSSSSDESYLNLGAAPDTLDPFSRFWGVLETMLDDISNPVAFATAPLDVPEGFEMGAGREMKVKSGLARDRKTSERAKGKEKATNIAAESFYVVPKEQSKASLPRPELRERAKSASPTLKTPEELALENASLRDSLDALAIHTAAIEKANGELQEQNEARKRIMQSAVAGVRLEAHKAKQGQDLMRSQLLASVSAPTTGRLIPPPLPPSDVTMAGSSSAGARKRINELEAEVSGLRADNEKKQAQIDKYKERFERFKTASRARKEAKVGSTGSTGVEKSRSAKGGGGQDEADEPG